MQTQVISQEDAQIPFDWQEHKLAIQAFDLSGEGWKWFNILSAPNNIGYEQGEIRPGKVGRWDMYFRLIQDFGIPKMEAMIFSGLTAEEIAEEDRLFAQEIETGISRYAPDFEFTVRMHRLLALYRILRSNQSNRLGSLKPVRGSRSFPQVSKPVIPDSRESRRALLDGYKEMFPTRPRV